MTTEYSISTDKKKLDLEVIHQFLSQEAYWSKNIPVEIVQRSIENSLCFGVYMRNDQVGFARVITDLATFGYLADVFILPEHGIRAYRNNSWLLLWLTPLWMAFAG